MLKLIKGSNLFNHEGYTDENSRVQFLPPVNDLAPLSGSSSKFTRVLVRTTSHNIFLTFGNFRIRVYTYLVGEKSPQASVSKRIGLKHRKVAVTFAPCILSSSIWEWTATRCFGSWKISLQTLNIRPEWSPIFAYAIRGDIRNVRRLLKEGLASPNDVTPDGWTVLHVSLKALQ